MITPPVGINVFVVKVVKKDVPLQTAFKGIYPFPAYEIMLVVPLLYFPQIALFLPRLMK